MSKRITQLHEITPEELKKEILDGIREIIFEYKSNSQPSGELLTRKEVAEKLSISLPTLRNYVKRGLLKEYRIGSRVLYKWSDILNSFPNQD